MSWPKTLVGRRWLPAFQHSVPSHDANRPSAAIRPMNNAGVGPKGMAKARPLAAFHNQNATKPAATARVRSRETRMRAPSRRLFRDASFTGHCR